MSAPTGHNQQEWLEYIGNNTSAEGSLPTGAATAAKQDTGNTSLSNIDTKVATQTTLAAVLALLAAGIPLDATTLAALETIQIGNWPGTQPVSAASLPLPTGAATSAAQGTANTSLGNIDTKTPALVNGGVPSGDNGPAWTVVRTYTTSADMTTAAALTVAPTGGLSILADDILISSDTAMSFTVQMETSNNVLAKVYLPANGTAQITLRDGLKGDLADKKLFGKASVAGNVTITACYHSI